MTNLTVQDKKQLTEYVARIIDLKKFVSCEMLYFLYSQSMKKVFGFCDAVVQSLASCAGYVLPSASNVI